MLSCEASNFSASLFRLNGVDRRVRVTSGVDGSYVGQRQTIAAGSYVRIPEFNAIDLSRGFTLQCWIWPTTPTKAGGQALAATQGFAFGMDDDGRLVLELGSGRMTHSGRALAARRWAFV